MKQKHNAYAPFYPHLGPAPLTEAQQARLERDQAKAQLKVALRMVTALAEEVKRLEAINLRLLYPEITQGGTNHER